MGLAEGVENALAAMQLHPGLIVWAGLSVSNLVNVVLPDAVEVLHMFLDGDEPGSPAAGAAAKAAVAHLDAGRRVQLHRAPVGSDWNDVLRERAGTVEQSNE